MERSGFIGAEEISEQFPSLRKVLLIWAMVFSVEHDDVEHHQLKRGVFLGVSVEGRGKHVGDFGALAPRAVVRNTEFRSEKALLNFAGREVFREPLQYGKANSYPARRR